MKAPWSKEIDSGPCLFLDIFQTPVAHIEAQLASLTARTSRGEQLTGLARVRAAFKAERLAAEARTAVCRFSAGGSHGTGLARVRAAFKSEREALESKLGV